MANLNLGQDVANKKTAAHIVAKSYPLCLYLAVRMHRYGSLFNINPFPENNLEKCPWNDREFP